MAPKTADGHFTHISSAGIGKRSLLGLKIFVTILQKPFLKFVQSHRKAFLLWIVWLVSLTNFLHFSTKSSWTTESTSRVMNIQKDHQTNSNINPNAQ